MLRYVKGAIVTHPAIVQFAQLLGVAQSVATFDAALVALRSARLELGWPGISGCFESAKMSLAESASRVLAVATFNRANATFLFSDYFGRPNVASVQPTHVVRLAPPARFGYSVATGD